MWKGNGYMNRSPFSKSIYQRGYEYYTEQLVNNVKCEDNTYFGTVSGTFDYDVTIVYRDYDDDEVIYMDCDCPYAMNGRACKHEAALYIYIQEMKLRQSSQMSDNPLARQLKLYKARGYSDFRIADFLKRDIQSQLYRIGIIKTYQGERVDEVFELIDNVLSLDIDESEKNKLLNEILKNLSKWKENNKYCDHFIDNCKKAILAEKHLSYINMMIWFLRKYDCKSIMNYIVSLLSSYNLKEDHVIQLMYYLYEFIEDGDIYEVLNKLSKYANLNSYRLLQVSQLLMEEKTDEALAIMKEQNLEVPKISSMLKLKEKIEYATKNKEGYLQFLLQYFVNTSHHEDVHFINRYKELCGEVWNEEKYQFLDTLVDKMSNDQKIKILNKIDEYDYVLNLVIENKEELVHYETLLKRHDVKMYRYLYLEYLRKELIVRNALYLSSIEEHLQTIEGTNPSDEELLEIILRLEDCVEYDTTIFEYLESYLKKKGFDRYVEIFEY